MYQVYCYINVYNVNNNNNNNIRLAKVVFTLFSVIRLAKVVFYTI